jgi:hypothetical protein
LKLRQRGVGPAPGGSKRAAGVEARLVTPRHRPRIAPPLPHGFVAAMIH